MNKIELLKEKRKKKEIKILFDLLNMRKKFSIHRDYYAVLAFISCNLFHRDFEVNGGHDSIAEFFVHHLFDRFAVMQAHFGHAIDVGFLNDRWVVRTHGAFSHFRDKILT